MDSQNNKSLKMTDQGKSSAVVLKYLSSPTASANSATSLDGPFNEKTSPSSPLSSNSNGNSNGEYFQMPILEKQGQNKMDGSPQEILVNIEIEGDEIQNICRVQPGSSSTKPDSLSTISNTNKVPSSEAIKNKNVSEGSGPVTVNVKQEKDGNVKSFKSKASAVADAFTNRLKEKFTTAKSIDVTDQVIRKEIDKNNAKFQVIVKTEAESIVQSDEVVIPEKKAKKVNNSEQSNNAEIPTEVLNSRPERPKRAASNRRHIGIEFPAEEQPYRRKKRSLTEVKSTYSVSVTAPAGTNIYQTFTAALNEPIAGTSSSLNGNGSTTVPRRISNRTSSKDNLSNGNGINNDHNMEVDDNGEVKAQKSASCDEISFAISYSDEDKKSLYKVGNFVINKKDAIYNPYELDRESSTEDLDIYQIEDTQLRLFEGLLVQDTVLHVSTEECILVTSKDDLYRDYQPIYVKVIHIVKPVDSSKPDHVFAKYFPVDRIGPVLNLIPKTERYIENFATCLQTITTECVSTGYMDKKIVQRRLPEEVFKAWKSTMETIQVFFNDLLEIIPWDKVLLQLLEKYPTIRISTSAEDKIRFSAGKLCHFCLSNKPGIKKLLVLYGRKYDNMDFSNVVDQKESDPIPTCNDCLTSVGIYSRTYHHLYHVYLTMCRNIEEYVEPLKFPEEYKPQDLINLFIHNKYFVQKMFLDFQVILAECETLTDDFYVLKEKQTKQENEANYAKLTQLIEKDESLQQLSMKPGPLKMKIKGVEKSIINQMQRIQIEQPAAPTPAIIISTSTSEIAPIVELQSQIDTSTSIKMEVS